VALAVAAFLCACGAPAPSPTPPPPTIPPEEAYPPVNYVTLLVYQHAVDEQRAPSKKACAVAAIPYHAHVKKGKDGVIVWDIVDDTCPVDLDKVVIEFAEKYIVELQSDERQAAQDPAMAKHKQKRGKITGKADMTAHKYTVKIPGMTHDPEIEIWP
jgi:hypothetical protein